MFLLYCPTKINKYLLSAYVTTLPLLCQYPPVADDMQTRWVLPRLLYFSMVVRARHYRGRQLVRAGIPKLMPGRLGSCCWHLSKTAASVFWSTFSHLGWLSGAGLPSFALSLLLCNVQPKIICSAEFIGIVIHCILHLACYFGTVLFWKPRHAGVTSSSSRSSWVQLTAALGLEQNNYTCWIKTWRKT